MIQHETWQKWKFIKMIKTYKKITKMIQIQEHTRQIQENATNYTENYKENGKILRKWTNHEIKWQRTWK